MATPEDADAYRDRLNGFHFLPDVADRLAVDYHLAYRTLARLGCTPVTDDVTGLLLLTTGHVDDLRTELARLARLAERSMPVSEAAAALGTGHSTINKWLREDRLTVDPECDAAGIRHVTRASVEAEAARRRPRTKPTVRLETFRAVTGFDEDVVRSLTRRGILRWAGRSRDRRLTAESVGRWIIGHRPDLIGSAIDRR